MDGLGEDLELVALVARLLQQTGGGGLAAEEQDLAVWSLGARGDGGLDAVDAGHDDIGYEHVWLEAVEGLDGGLSAVDGARLEAGLVEDDGQRVGDDLFVVGHEDPAFGRRCGGCFSHAESPLE